MTPGITWLASYPKSGNTWLRVFLDNWFADADAPIDINALSPQACSPNDRARFESATLLSSDTLLPQEIEQLRLPVMQLLSTEVEQPALVKLHNAFTPAFGPGIARAAVYVVRDPRDVVPSLAAHLGVSLDAAIDFLNSRKSLLSGSTRHLQKQLPHLLSDWSGHVRSWMDGTGLPLHVVRYEDLPGAFAGVLRFLGEAEDSGRLQRAIRHSRIEELQRQESNKGFKERQNATPFFRQGQAGAWRRTLTAAQAARIERTHGEMMERFGYRSGLAASA